MAKERFISAKDVRERWGHSNSTLQGWRRYCPALERAIKTKHCGTDRRHHFYLEDDLEKIANPPALVDGRYEDSQGVWLTWAAAKRAYHFGHKTLERWRRKTCPALGQKLQAKQILALHYGKVARRWVYLESGLQIITEVRRTANAPARCDYLTVAEAARGFHTPKPTLEDWIRKGCPWIDGSQIRWRWEVRKNANRWMRVKVVSREDLQAAVMAKSRGIQDKRSGWTTTEASREIDVHPTTIIAWGRKPHPALDGRCVHSWVERRQLKGGGRRDVRLYNKNDLLAIRDWRMKAAQFGVVLEEGLLTLTDAARTFGKNYEQIRWLVKSDHVRHVIRKLPDRRGYLRRHVCVYKSDIETALATRNGRDTPPPIEPPFIAAADPAKKSTPKNSVVSPNDDRDEWLYEKDCEGVSSVEIIRQLKPLCDEKGWSLLDEWPAIRKATNRYAGSHGLSAPPTRQQFRQQKSR